MRIKSVEVGQFKSLVGFRLDLAKFTCLIGLNGSGKSTVLQFFDFLAAQMRGELADWLKERGWAANDILTRPLTRQKVHRTGSAEFRNQWRRAKAVAFAVSAVDEEQHEAHWEGLFEPERLQCTAERLQTQDAELIVDGGKYSIRRRKVPDVSATIPFTYEGSILSRLREDILPPSLLRFKQLMLQTESLDMLTPDRLRQQAADAHGSLGHGGRNLSAFLHELGASGRKELTKRLQHVYKRLDRIHAKTLPSGLKQLQVVELFREEENGQRKTFGDKRILTEATHINDGMLRLIAILAELASDHEFLLFDEIENGINPELVEFVTDALVEAKQQIMVTTHSPMILNFLEDDIAAEGVIYLYKTRAGFTRSIPFFSIPSLQKKLSVMGPGEAFVDTDLAGLVKEIDANTPETS